MTIRNLRIPAVVLPAGALIAVPSALLLLTGEYAPQTTLSFTSQLLFFGIGCALVSLGSVLLMRTIDLFAEHGKGTLAPWRPPENLVVIDVYLHVRNPMILGVLLILAGEAVIFSSHSLLIWTLLFLVANHIYFVKSEEPDLVTRFGNEYLEYKRNVPRWIPRLAPWERGASNND